MSLDVTCWQLGPLDTNCYLATDTESQRCLIIDPADDGQFINDEILRAGLTPVGIVYTHGHFDHILAALEVQLAWNIPVYGHEADTFLIESVQQRARRWVGMDVDPAPPPTTALHEGMTLRVGSEELQILETPGHTPGSITLYNEQLAFTGDTLFAEGVGRTDFSYANALDLYDSIDKIRQLPEKTLILSGHGESIRLGEIRFGSLWL